jgi:hypothetical protein
LGLIIDANNRDFQTFYYYGEDDGRKIVSTDDRWIPTGIGMMKYVNPKESYKDGTVYPKVDPAIRYADILLMYAEALNELTSSFQLRSWDGSETYTVSRDIAAMKAAVLPVRLRAGLPNYDEIGMKSSLNCLRRAAGFPPVPMWRSFPYTSTSRGSTWWRNGSCP